MAKQTIASELGLEPHVRVVLPAAILHLASKHEDTEYHRAVAALTEWERAPYDDPMTYRDTH